MKKIICKTCYFRDRFEKEDWCKIIENEGGGSIEADQTECPYYLKKGTEPKWLCYKCGKNTYGGSSTSSEGKHWCSSCWCKKEAEEHIKRERIKRLEDTKKVEDILGGDEKTARIIIDTLFPKSGA